MPYAPQVFYDAAQLRVLHLRLHKDLVIGVVLVLMVAANHSSHCGAYGRFRVGLNVKNTLIFASHRFRMAVLAACAAAHGNKP